MLMKSSPQTVVVGKNPYFSNFDIGEIFPLGVKVDEGCLNDFSVKTIVFYHLPSLISIT